MPATLSSPLGSTRPNSFRPPRQEPIHILNGQGVQRGMTLPRIPEHEGTHLIQVVLHRRRRQPTFMPRITGEALQYLVNRTKRASAAGCACVDHAAVLPSIRKDQASSSQSIMPNYPPQPSLLPTTLMHHRHNPNLGIICELSLHS